MTIEEKAKAYDEAIKRAKPLMLDTNFSMKNTVVSIFPELAESEDERIRTWLIYYFDKVNDEVVKEDRLKIITYLKKRKEPHYSPLCNTVKDKIREYVDNHFIADTVVKTDMRSIVNAMKEGVRLGKEEQKPLSTEETELNSIAFLEQMGYTCIPPGKEQKPDLELIKQSWYMEGYIDGKFKREPMWNMKTDDGMPRYEKNEKYGQPLEQKPAKWSEVDEDYLEEIISDLKYAAKYRKTCSKELAEKCIHWLKSLPEKFNPQSKQEWSEKDDAILKEIVSFLKDGTVKLQHDLDLYAGFLQNKFKSLCLQPKVELNNEDKTMFMSCLLRLRTNEGVDTKNSKWFETRFASLCAQPHWEPSKRILDAMINALKQQNDVAKGCELHWKPSEEQMEALRMAIKKALYREDGLTAHIARILKSLDNDLKELM